MTLLLQPYIKKYVDELKENKHKDHTPKIFRGNGPNILKYIFRLWGATIIEPVIRVIT